MQGYTIVFDLDGTLVDTAPDLIGATNHALNGMSIPAVEGALLRPWISFGARRMIVEALAVSKTSLPERDVDRLLDAFLSYYEANIACDSKPYAGVIAAAETLIGTGARLAVCTNKRQALSDQLLNELGITRLFTAIAGRDAFPVCKPHPDHLTGTIARAGGDPARAIMVGDSEVDIATAKAAGIPVVAVTFGYSQVPVAELAPDALIDHYDHLPASLEAIRNRIG
jgi:phosphoglycolate phosphatase